MMRVDSTPEARNLPSGARFYKCALQINPFEYLGRHKKQTPFKSETDYNNAIMERCEERKIEVIAVTDHYRVSSSRSLVECAKAAGIHVFPGFEAATKDGVHFLCLFDPTKDLNALERVVGDCGIHDQSGESPTGKYDALELLEESRKWNAACVAAHIAGQGGL
ncbi:MAG: PHP domain-containing protein, partial [bacterium]